MLRRRPIQALCVYLGLCTSTTMMADGVNLHLTGGVSLADLGSSQNLLLTTDYSSLYNTSGATTSSPFAGLGIGYQWNNILKNIPLALNLGISGYYLHNTISGTEYPGGNTSYQTLSYNADDNTLAGMLEPKLIYTRSTWQPYFLAGVGIASNALSNFNEQSVAGSNGHPAENSWFADNTDTHFAYEFGFGLQHALYDTKSGGALIMGLEYRYMSLGPMEFGPAPAQTTTPGLNLGTLQTNIIDATLSYQF